MRKLTDLSSDLSETLETTANNIVGNVGKSSKKRIAETGENYVEIVFRFENENDIIEQWVNYIKSYMVVAKNVFRGDMETINRNPTIYWSTKPDILLSDGDDLASEDMDCFILYSVFLISNRGRLQHDT